MNKSFENTRQNSDIRKTALLREALAALRRSTGLELDVVDPGGGLAGADYGVLLEVKALTRIRFSTDIRHWAAHANFGALVHRLQTLPQRSLLVADYVNPPMADRLREQGINFIDACGNAFLDAKPLFLFVKGNRSEGKNIGGPPAARGIHRLFEPKGLKVVFALLSAPQLVARPYREMAQASGVALGTVGSVIKGLKLGGYLQEGRGRRKRQLVSPEKLLERWVEAWPLKLRPRLELAIFRVDQPRWWKDADLTEYEASWGGEVAAAEYTEALRPELATVYLPRVELQRLILDARLRPDSEVDRGGMRVQFLEKFWAIPEASGGGNGLVPHVLTYADLVASGKPRNLQVAKLLGDQLLENFQRARSATR